jgi:hypothetical protein
MKEYAIRFCAIATLAFPTTLAATDAAENITIESLLKGGWKIAGYAGTFDNRTSLILFQHPTEPYLVQCGTIHDVTRTPRTFSNCYALH